MKQLNATTFQTPELGGLKPTVIIGGKPADKFIPNVNISFHDDEFFINLNRKDKLAVSSCTNPVELPGEDTDIWHIDENGRLKWDIEFSERPAVNTWTWELKHTNGIEFFYQGELTPEEIERGAERPKGVVGSYAVYCDRANNKYKTGKLCHVYRPFCYDANGNHIYADLLISDGQLTITVDETWLDNAVYPVRLDPTFGYTAQGGTTQSASSSYAWGTRFLSPAAGNAESLSAYISHPSWGGRYWKYVLCEYNSNSSPVLSGTAEGSGSSSGWSELSLLATSQIQKDTEYVLVLQGSGGEVVFYSDSAGATANQQGYVAHQYSDTWGSSLAMSFSNAFRFSIYCTYTESGGSSGNTYYYQQMQM